MDCNFGHRWSRAQNQQNWFLPPPPSLSPLLSLCWLLPRQVLSKTDLLAILGFYHPDSNPRRKSFFSSSSAKILKLNFPSLSG